LKYTDNIRRFLAAFTLLLFCLCVTPKRVLHDLLANHRDTQAAMHLPVEQLTPSGFHCHVEDLVVVAPFLPSVQTVNLLPFHEDAFCFAEPVCVFFFGYQSGPVNRGPPSIC